MKKRNLLAIFFSVIALFCLADKGAAYSRGTVTDLGTLGGAYSYAMDINDSGQIVGYSELASGQFHPFLYSGGTMTDLGPLGVGPYGSTSSQALGINNNGQIVGRSITPSGQFHASHQRLLVIHQRFDHCH